MAGVVARSMERVSEEKIQALRLQPGARRLLHALSEVNGAYLVGGAVRDLLLGFAQIDFDVAFEGDAAELAAFLTDELGGRQRLHERFNTASVELEDGVVVDIAATRSETYEHPGALPTVAPAGMEQDLARRDFSVNAIAMALWQRDLGKLTTFPGAVDDLTARVLRVLHDASFEDDPTRLLRLVRYGARLGFAAEPHTESLARKAVRGGAVATVSRQRIGGELLDLLGERAAVVGVEALAALGLDSAIHPQLLGDEYLAARATLRRDEGLRQDLLLLAVCCRQMDPVTLVEFVESLGLLGSDRDIVIDVVEHSTTVAQAAEAAGRPSELAAAMRGRRPETAALAAALPEIAPATRDAIHQWLDARAKDHLLIGGGDLRAAGVPEGPAIGRALAATLDGALDGNLDGREAQLSFALNVARAPRRDHVAD